MDRDRCQGHWVCVSEAPEVFGADEKSAQERILDETPNAGFRAKLQRTVRYCPTRALTLRED